MTNEQPKRSFFARPGFLFSVAGVWLLLAVTEFFVSDGGRRWFSVSLGLLLTVLSVAQGIATLRKVRAERADT